MNPIIQFRPLANKDMATYEARLKTYATAWPASASKTPEELAKAGFYYLGEGDKVRCFFCFVGLNDWRVQDNPWVEHAIFMSDCPFLRLNRRICDSSLVPDNSIAELMDKIENSALADLDENVKNEITMTLHQSLCKICISSEADHLVLPCSHLALCLQCVATQEKCIICRKRVQAVIRVFK